MEFLNWIIEDWTHIGALAFLTLCFRPVRINIDNVGNADAYNEHNE